MVHLSVKKEDKPMKFLLYLLTYSSILIITSINPWVTIISFVLFISLTVPFYFLIFNFEYFAFIFLIVYLGAFVILFLFVIISSDMRTREQRNHLFFWNMCISFIIFSVLDVLVCSVFDDSILSTFNFSLESTLSNVWPQEDIDFYVFVYNEMWFLVVIAAVILILSLFCVIVIGDFIKKL